MRLSRLWSTTAASVGRPMSESKVPCQTCGADAPSPQPPPPGSANCPSCFGEAPISIARWLCLATKPCPAVHSIEGNSCGENRCEGTMRVPLLDPALARQPCPSGIVVSEWDTAMSGSPGWGHHRTKKNGTSDYRCPKCHGQAFIPTEDGMKLVLALSKAGWDVAFYHHKDGEPDVIIEKEHEGAFGSNGEGIETLRLAAYLALSMKEAQ